MFHGNNQEDSIIFVRDKITTVCHDCNKWYYPPGLKMKRSVNLDWVERLGTALIKDIEVRIGGQLVGTTINTITNTTKCNNLNKNTVGHEFSSECICIECSEQMEKVDDMSNDRNIYVCKNCGNTSYFDTDDMIKNNNILRAKKVEYELYGVI